MPPMPPKAWTVATAYECYVGRWSRLVGRDFLRLLDVPAERSWLDVGCGTGALTGAVVAAAQPARVVGVDRSVPFLATASAALPAATVSLVAGDATRLPLHDGAVDAAVSGLALNFVPDPPRAVAELARVTSPGGAVAAYVWDYAGGMAMMRVFWDAATALDPDAAVDEGRRFAMCRPEPLAALWNDAGLHEVEVHAVEIPTHFADFDDYWQPFLGAQGPAPAYVATLPDRRRDELRDRVRDLLPEGPDGSIRLTARAWAVTGRA